VHRLYPRLPSKWRHVVKQAITEASAARTKVTGGESG